MSSYDRKNRSAIASAGACCLLVMLPACVSVHPEKDYAKAAGMVAEQTGAEDVYNPTIDGEVADKVATLLEDGLTLDEATSIALLNNRGFQAMFYSIGASRADVVQSSLLTNPGVSLSVRFPDGGGRSNVSFGLAQELVDLWQIPVRKKIAEEQLGRVVSNVVRAAEDLSAQTQAAYYGLAGANESVTVAKENLAMMQESERLAKDRFQAGESTILDLNLLKVSVSEERMRLMGLERDRRLAQIALSRSLGLVRQGDTYALGDGLPGKIYDIPSEGELTDRALLQRYDVVASQHEVDAAEAEIARQRRAVFPSVVVGLDGERPERRAPRSVPYNPFLNYPLLSPPNQTAQDRAYEGATRVGDFVRDRLSAKRDRDLEKSQAIDLLLGPSIQFTLPIWDQNQAQVAKARLMYFEKQKQHEDLLESVAQEVQKAAAELRNAAEQARLYRESVLPQAEENVATARRAYEAGEETILALLEAQRSLVRQREAYVDALVGYAAAKIELERVVGGPLVAAADTGTEQG